MTGGSKGKAPFDVQTFLASSGPGRAVAPYRKRQVIYAQGDHCDSVFYIHNGRVKLSVVSHTGRDAVVAILESGEFFGEGCLAAQPTRMSTATAMMATTLVQIEKATMVRLLHTETAFADRFINHMLARNVRIEADLVHQLFNNTERRLARALLLVAQYGKTAARTTTVPSIPQETLAEMVGTTRSRVNFFMRKFQRLGFIKYNGGLTIHHSLVTVVLHE